MAVTLKNINKEEMGLVLIEALASGLTIRPTEMFENSFWVDDPFFVNNSFVTAIYWTNTAGWVGDCSCGQPDLCLHIALAHAERRKQLEQLAGPNNVIIPMDRLPVDFQSRWQAKRIASIRTSFCECGEPLTMRDLFFSGTTGAKCQDCRESGK